MATEAHKEMKRIESRKDLSSPFTGDREEAREDQEAALATGGSVRGSLQAYADLLAEAQKAEEPNR